MRYLLAVCAVLLSFTNIFADEKDWLDKVNTTRSRIRTLSYSYNVFVGADGKLTGNTWEATKLTEQLQPHFDPFVEKEAGKLKISRDPGANYAVDAWNNPIRIFKDGDSVYFYSYGADGKPEENVYDKDGKPLSAKPERIEKEDQDLICLHTPQTGSSMCDMIRSPQL